MSNNDCKECKHYLTNYNDEPCYDCAGVSNYKQYWEMNMLEINNYHSLEMNNKFMSFSTFKSLSPAFGGCEAKGMAVLNGEIENKPSDAMLTGSYVDAYMSGTLESFIESHPEMFASQGKTKGQLKSVYKPEVMDKIFEIIDNDMVIKSSLEGDKQEMGVVEWKGVEWKYAIDNINHEKKFLTDLKIVREIYAKTWCDTHYEYNLNNFGYFHQIALYTFFDRLRNGRDRYYTPYLTVISKENPPDRALIQIYYDDEQLDAFINSKLLDISSHLSRVIALWNRDIEPAPCRSCDYCRSKMNLTKTISYMDFD